MNISATLRLNKLACFTFICVVLLLIYFGRNSGSSYKTELSDFVNLKLLLNAAIYAAERGGRRVFEGSKINLNMRSKGKTREGANDPVTDADFASHCAMFYSLKQSFPKLNVISEEHAKDEESCSKQEPLPVDEVPLGHQIIYFLHDEHVFNKDVTVWIDPLDATQEYTEGMYEYVTTMVCIAVKGVPVIGVIHFPFAQQTYWGWLLKQTSDNLAPVTNNEKHKENPHVVVSRSHPGKVTQIAKKVFGEGTVITAAAGAGYKVITVANGTQDIYFHTSYIKKWDICAGDAIINTLGGQMTTLKGERINYLADSEVKVKEGLLVSRFNHPYYLKKVLKQE